MRKVLIANRGEIAVRVVAGLPGRRARQRRRVRRARPATRCSCDWPTRPTRWAGRPARRPTWTSTRSSRWRRSPARDAVHPGYGFLAENAEFAQAVVGGRADLDRPAAGGHRGARRQGAGPAHRAGGRGAARPGHPGPGPGRRGGASAFAREYGYPVAIKAAFGGGGRGLKVARRDGGGRRPVRVGGPRGDRRRSAAASASSSATWTGRGTSRRSAWPTRYGQRGGDLDPGLLAAAPAPEAGRGGARAVPDRGADQDASTESSKAILRRGRLRRRGHLRVPRRPGRHDLASSRSTPGSRSSTRSARRSPASTWSARCSGSPRARRSATTTRPSAGTRSSSGSTPRTRAATSCPPRARSPRGTRRRGPGVRLDAGYDGRDDRPAGVRLADRQADRDRRQPGRGTAALGRAPWPSSRSAGMPTVLPFHRAVVADPAFVAPSRCGVHTRWIETEFDTPMPRRRTAEVAGAGRAGAADRRGGRGRGSRWSSL